MKAIEIKVPEIGESITEVEIGGWLKAQGQKVEKDEPLVALESEKATVEMPAPEAGTLAEILKQKGEVAKVGEVIARLEPDGQEAAAAKTTESKRNQEPTEAKAKPASPPSPPRAKPTAEKQSDKPIAARVPREPAEPPANAELRVEKAREEMADDAEEQTSQAPQQKGAGQPVKKAGSQIGPPTPPSPAPPKAPAAARAEEVVPMSRLRRTVAERLVEAQRNAALLTTFNEADMSAVIALREQHGEPFKQRYQVKLGLMSFFVKASIDALKLFPALNAEVRGANIVYRNYYDLGVAIGSAKGLVVPVLRNAELLSFAEVEIAIGDFAKRAQENKLKVEELQGGTFTLSNGGVYGSLLSTPIINPPQSGVLGLHAIQPRPVARDGNVVIKPMMYLALTYDHRVVDGREAVSFLKLIKEVIETPARMLLEV